MFVISSFCCFFYCIVLISVCLLRTLGGYKLSAWQPLLELRIQTSKKNSARSSFLACAEEVSRTSEQRSHKYRKPQKVFPRFSDRKDQNKTKKHVFVRSSLLSRNSVIMSRWGRKDVKKAPEVIRTVTEGLKSLYRKKLLPLEQYYGFHDFHSPSLEDADFDNKPMVLVVGQYSTGKTTFIK